MTNKALKLLLSIQAKISLSFMVIYVLTIAILLILPSFISIDDSSSIPVITEHAPKLYLMAMGIIYPLIATKLFVSQGLTRKQFFWAYTGAMSIISIFLLIPTFISAIYFNSISLLFVMTQYLQMPLFLLIGWTSVIGFQMRKWYTSIAGILVAVLMYFTMLTVLQFLTLSGLIVLGTIIVLLATSLFILPRIFTQVTLTC